MFNEVDPDTKARNFEEEMEAVSDIIADLWLQECKHGFWSLIGIQA